VERTGRIVDSLEFYENWESNVQIEADRRFRRERWVAVKRRQLERERDAGNRSRVSEIERHLNSAYVMWSIKASNEFPAFPAITDTNLSDKTPEVDDSETMAKPLPAVDTRLAEVEDPLTCIMGEVKIGLSKRSRRANLSHVHTLETAVVKWATGLVWTGEVIGLQQADSWRCDAWRVTLRYRAGQSIEVAFDCGLAAVLPIDCEPISSSPSSSSAGRRAVPS